MEEKLLALLDKYDLRSRVDQRLAGADPVLQRRLAEDGPRDGPAAAADLPRQPDASPTSRPTRTTPSASGRASAPSINADVGQHRARELPRRAPVHDQRPSANMNAALAAGVDGMFTNFADVLIGILGPRKATGPAGRDRRQALARRLPRPQRHGRRRRHGAGDALADPRRARQLRRVHARAWRRTTRPSTTANVISIGRQRRAEHRRSEPIATASSINGTFALPQPLLVDATSAANVVAGPTAAVGGTATDHAAQLRRAGLQRPVTVNFKQSIGAGDALRTGHVREDAHADARRPPLRRGCEDAPRTPVRGVALSGNRTARKTARAVMASRARG